MIRFFFLILFNLTSFTLFAMRESDFFPIEDLKSGLRGKCYAELSSDKGIEPFDFEIIGIIRDALGLNLDLIAAKVLDDKFLDNESMSVLNGSPAYINNKILGSVGYNIKNHTNQPVIGIFLIKNIFEASAISIDTNNSIIVPISMPLISRGLQMSFFETFDRALKDIGYDGLCFEIDRLGDTARLGKKIAPGSAIAVSLIDGDMNLYSLCAVTAISDGKFSTCGHFFSGAGRVNLPVMSASVSDNGFFLKDTYRASNVLEPFGKITKDCGLFAFGELGVFYDFTQMSVYLENTSYNYRVSKDKKGMPVYVSMALSNALNGSSWKNFEIGECCIDVRLHVKNRETVFFVRKFSERGAELRKKIINQFLSDMSVLLNKYINFSDLEKIEFDVKQRKSLGSLELKKIKTEPIPAASGDNLKIDLIFKSIDDCDKVSSVNISLPENLPEGCYDLFACSRSASFDIENTFHGEKNDKINASIIDNLILKSRDDEVFIYLKKKAYSNKTEANRHDALPFISAILFKKIESSLFKVGRYRLPAIVSGALNSEIFINNKYENNNN